MSEFSAVLNGEITRIGDSDSADVFFQYGSSSVDDNTTPAASVNSLQTFSESISGLSATQTVDVRAVATAEQNTRDEGSVVSFTTDPIVIDGVVTVDSTAVSGAFVGLFDLTTETLVQTATSASDGSYSFDLGGSRDQGDVLAIFIQYEGAKKYGRLVTVEIQ